MVDWTGRILILESDNEPGYRESGKQSEEISMKKTMRAIVTGASGLLGRELMRILSSDFIVEGWAYRRAENLKRINLFEVEKVEEAFRQFNPDIIIHAAAERRPDNMERYPEQSWELNVGVTERIARLSHSLATKFIFISTDYIFDGTAPSYSEESALNPLNSYGKSKAEAENLIQKTFSQYCILRIPILYGPSTDITESAVTVLLKKLCDPSQKEIFFDDAAIRYPTLTTDVARTIRFLIEKKSSGIYHYTAEEPYTKYGMAVLMASLLKIKDKQIYPDPKPGQGAQRPLNAHLNSTKIRRLGFNKYTQFRVGIESVLQKLQV